MGFNLPDGSGSIGAYESSRESLIHLVESDSHDSSLLRWYRDGNSILGEEELQEQGGKKFAQNEQLGGLHVSAIKHLRDDTGNPQQQVTPSMKRMAILGQT